jgi:peptide/nickel transport system substrate-binding protein
MRSVRDGTRWWVAVVLIAALVATGCGGDSGGTDQTAAESGEPQTGGELTFGQQSLAAILDPAKLDAVQAGGPGNEAFAVFGALLVADNESGEMEPLLAESLESTDEGTTWMLKLRPELTFTDGTPFDAEAVRYNWDRIMDPATASPAHGIMEAEVASYEVVDPLTLEITLNRQNTLFPRLLTSAMTFIGSPTALAADPERFGSEPVGAGPFMVERFARDSELVLTRNPDYFDAPRPYVDRVVVNVNPDEEQRYRALTSGGADIMVATTRAKEQTATDDGLGVLATPQGMVGFIAFNTSQAPLDDIRVRRAFAMAIDTAALCQARNAGVACPEPLAHALFPEDSSFYEPEQDMPEMDLAGAQELIDEYLEDEGLDSIDVAMSVVSNPDQVNLATVVQANLSELDGVDVSVDPLELTTLRATVGAAEHQMASGSLTGTYPYPSLVQYLVAGGTLNGVFGNYSSPEIEEAVEQIQSTFDADEQAEGFKAIARQVAEDVPFAVRDSPVFMQIYNDNVQGVATWSDNILRTDLVWLNE